MCVDKGENMDRVFAFTTDENMWEFKKQLLEFTTAINMYTKKDDTFLNCILVKVSWNKSALGDITVDLYNIFLSIEVPGCNLAS